MLPKLVIIVNAKVQSNVPLLELSGGDRVLDGGDELCLQRSGAQVVPARNAA